MRSYRFVDWATQGFLAAVILVVMGLHRGSTAEVSRLVAAHLVVMAALHALIVAEARGLGGWVVRFLRAVYPLALFTPFFRETELVNRLLGAPRLDPAFLGWEQRLFGTQPSVAFMETFPQPWFSEVMYASYFSYYFMVAGTGLWLWFRDPAAFRRFISVVSFVFYSCYLIYAVTPVVGPRLLFRPTPERDWYASHYPGLPLPSYPDSVQHGPFFQIMAFIYRHFEALSAAFPSSHVAIALTTLWFSWHHFPRLRWLHLGIVVLLCASTVYCRYHYAVDVPAGILAALVLIPTASALFRRLDPPVGIP